MAGKHAAAYAAYRALYWTSEGDECEAGCGGLLGPDQYVEGDLGHYCSAKCRDESESGPETDFREDFHSDG